MTFQEWKAIPDKNWTNEPLSCTCEFLVCYKRVGDAKTPIFCGNATAKAYPAMGKGWQSLCQRHAKRHPEAFDVYELIANGERWA